MLLNLNVSVHIDFLLNAEVVKYVVGYHVSVLGVMLQPVHNQVLVLLAALSAISVVNITAPVDNLLQSGYHDWVLVPLK